MTFVVMGIGTTFNAIVNRRDPASGLTPPFKGLLIALVPFTMLFLATQLPTLQQGLLTAPLTPREWLVCVALAALLPIAVEVSKVVRRRHAAKPEPADIGRGVSPARARA